MNYTITNSVKRLNGNLVWQLWRFTCLSLKFRKLTRQVA
jgi:hypothetical protein